MNPVQKLTLELKHLSGAIQSAGVAATNVASTVRAIVDLGQRLNETGVSSYDIESMMQTLNGLQTIAETFNIRMENLLKEFQNGFK